MRKVGEKGSDVTVIVTVLLYLYNYIGKNTETLHIHMKQMYLMHV